MSEKVTKKSKIEIEVGLNENHIPLEINWSAEDAGEQSSKSNAMMLSMWDPKQQNSMRMDLWTKDMTVDEMKMFFHQTLLTMADSFERSTNEHELALDMRDFCDYFGKRIGVKPQ